jgi:hypothetical protein
MDSKVGAIRVSSQDNLSTTAPLLLDRVRRNAGNKKSGQPAHFPSHSNM